MISEMKPLYTLAVIAVVFCALPLTAHADTVSGTVRYENKLYDSNGFTGGTEYRPIRYADVEVVRASDSVVLGSGETTGTGTYTIAIANAGSVSIYLRVYARQDNASFNVVVKNNASSAQIYTATTSAGAQDTNSPVTIDLDVSVAGGAAGAFNIFDMGIYCWEFQASVDASFPGVLPQLLVYWESGSTNGTYYDSSLNAIFLLGKASDTDEFDDDIVLHEMGHFVASNFSKDSSPGGAHAITGHYDLRLAWSEGWATYWSAAVRNFAGAARYPSPQSLVDTFGSGNSIFEIETPSFSSTTTMATNEVAVAAALWDIADANNEGGFDTISLGDDEIWTVFETDLSGRTQITMEDFFISFIARYPAETITTQDILAARSIKYYRDARDPFGLENDSAGTASVLSGTVTTNTFYPVGDQDWFAFAATAGDSIVIDTLNLGDGCDTVLTLYDTNGVTVLATNDDRSGSDVSSIIQYSITATGTYYVKATPYSSIGFIAELGTFDLRLTVAVNNAPSISSVSASVSSGSAPLLVRLSATATDSDGGVALYQWDFNGDGVIDYTSRESASVVYTFAMAGTFDATLTVTDTTGGTATSSVAITVTSSVTPDISTSVTGTGTVAPVTASFSASVSGITPTLYQWDFNSDGIIDFSSISSATTTTVYGLPGSYLARLIVTDTVGRSFASDPKQVTVDAGSNPPVFSSLTPSSSTGNVPLTITLTGVATDDSSISKLEWDFEGDGIYDRQTTSAVNVVSYTYTRPGSFTPTLRVTDDSGLQVTGTTTLSVEQLSTAGWMLEPSMSDVLSGDFTTLRAEVVPAGTSKSVQFQYRVDSPVGSWVNIGSAITSSGTIFTTTWDITAFAPSSVFDLRALVDGATSTGDNACTVTISSVSPNITEYTDTDGTTVKEKIMDATRTSELFMGNGAGMVLPLGSSNSTTTITVRARTVGTNTHGANGSADGLGSISENHQFSVISGATTFKNDFTLVLPYADNNNNNYVDATNVVATTLQIHWYSTGPARWRRDTLGTVDRAQKRVEVACSHMTEFGAFGSVNLGAAGGGGGGGGRCYLSTAVYSADDARTHTMWFVIGLFVAAIMLVRSFVKRTDACAKKA